MIKKYLVNGVMALALGLIAVSCSKDTDFSEADYKNNAEKILGVTIDPTQDWKMTQSVNAQIRVNLGLDQQYTVAVYDKNPLSNKDVNYYGKTTVTEGGTANMSLALPTASNTYYVGVFDSKFRQLVKSVTVEDGKLNASFGGNAAAQAPRRAAEADYTGTFAKTAADYLDGLTEADMNGYIPFTDNDIDGNGYIFGSSTSNSPKKRSKRVGQSVNAEFFYKVEAGYDPSNGDSQYLYMGNEPIAKITYGGEGEAAEASNEIYGMEAKINRSYIIFKSLVNGSGGITFYHVSKGNSSNGTVSLIVDNVTTNLNVSNSPIYQNDYYMGAPQGGDSYKFYFSDNSPITFYGFKYYANGSTIEDTDGGNSGEGNEGGEGGESTPAVKHYLVDTNTEITKTFHITVGEMNGAVIYVKGKLNLGEECTLNGVTVVVASGGEVALSGSVDMSTYARFIVLPGGSITGADDSGLTVTNGSKCYNAGTIEYDGLLNTNGSDFYNCGTINVTTLRNTSSTNGNGDVSKITNFGHITAVTNEISADAYNCTFINGCYWQYTSDAGIGNLTMLDNSRLEVGGKLLIPGTVTLYNASEISVNDLQVQETTFNAPTTTGEFAVLKIANDIYAGYGGDFNSSGNLYADWGNADQGLYVNGVWSDLDNQWSVYGIIKGKMDLIKESSSPVSIPEGDCTGTGYNPDGESEEEEIPGKPNIYTYAFEDTFMGDYDMNDVVIQVWEDPDDNSQLKIKLCCTGASNELKIYLGTSTKALFTDTEVHQALGGLAPTFINTGTKSDEDDASNDKFQKGTPCITTITKPDGFNFEEADFWIKSPAGEIHVGTRSNTSQIGNAPYGIMVPKEWAWPYEWVPVNEAYEDFSKWAADKNTYLNWYDFPEESKTRTNY